MPAKALSVRGVAGEFEHLAVGSTKMLPGVTVGADVEVTDQVRASGPQLCDRTVDIVDEDAHDYLVICKLRRRVASGWPEDL